MINRLRIATIFYNRQPNVDLGNLRIVFKRDFINKEDLPV